MLPGDLEKKQNQTFKSRSGSVKFRPPWTYYPKNETEISQIIGFSREQNQKLRPAGAGHAHAPYNETETALVRVDRMSGLVHVNRDAREAIVWAGTRLGRLSGLLAEQGLALPYPAARTGHTLAGALAVGAHGADPSAAMLASRVSALTMVTGRGDIIVCTAKKNPDVFRAALLSLGALGVVTKISLNLESLAPVREEMQTEDFDDGIKTIQAAARKPAGDFLEFFYIPHTDKILTRRLHNETGDPGKPTAGGWKDASLAVISGATGFVPALARPLARITGGLYHRPAARLTNANLTRPFLGRGLRMEYALPREKAGDALASLREALEQKQAATLLPVALSFAPADDILLSPANGRPTAFLSVRAPVGPIGRQLVGEMEGIFTEHDGRPHWGSFYSESTGLADRFPGANDFKRIRGELDPDGVLLNPALQGLFGA